MNRTIWKFEIDVKDIIEIELPDNSKLLKIMSLPGAKEILVFWYLVHKPCELKAVDKFRVYGTGHNIPNDSGEYIDTIKTERMFVWHVFRI